MMKARVLTSIFFALLLSLSVNAQDKTTVRANSSDISDNLDLRAVATLFGDSRDLEDFERRLNDPKSQISNLDLNNDNYVDYLRVIETVEGNAHIIVIQAVLGKDLFQDVASVEVEKDRNNNVTVQVVGDVYMYGNNYIYEPVYVHRPVIYTTFWAPMYRPYYSNWYWGYYPSYYTFWQPFPIFRYQNHIALHINFGHSFHYVSNRRCYAAYNVYYGHRGNAYERMYPNRSFSNRNIGYTNRREMDYNRNIRTRVPETRELASSSRGTANKNRATNGFSTDSRNLSQRNITISTQRSETNSRSSNVRNTNSTIQNSRSVRFENNNSTRNNQNMTRGTTTNQRNVATPSSPTRYNNVTGNTSTPNTRSTVNSGGNSRSATMNAPTRNQAPRQNGNSGESRNNSGRNGRM